MMELYPSHDKIAMPIYMVLPWHFFVRENSRRPHSPRTQIVQLSCCKEQM